MTRLRQQPGEYIGINRCKNQSQIASAPRVHMGAPRAEASPQVGTIVYALPGVQVGKTVNHATMAAAYTTELRGCMRQVGETPSRRARQRACTTRSNAACFV